MRNIRETKGSTTGEREGKGRKERDGGKWRETECFNTWRAKSQYKKHRRGRARKALEHRCTDEYYIRRKTVKDTCQYGCWEKAF